MLPSLADTPSAEEGQPFFILVAALLSWFKLAATGQVSALPATCISHLQKDYGLSPSSPKESLQQQTSRQYLYLLQPLITLLSKTPSISSTVVFWALGLSPIN
jgi:hypothetical protein